MDKVRLTKGLFGKALSYPDYSTDPLPYFMSFRFTILDYMHIGHHQQLLLIFGSASFF